MHSGGERQYTSLVERIIRFGTFEIDRTKIGTYTLLGQHMRFNLEDNVIPVLTTKTIFWRGVVGELLWFLSGSTDERVLSSKGITIWSANAAPQYLKTRGIENTKPGDLGPIYGFQWRHFGAKYIDHETDYTGQGVDQLKNVLDALIKTPNDRRIILSAWNPCDLGKMALPPCHAYVHFRVINSLLTCMLTQRSCDMGLGVPFNLASYGLLTHLIAHACNIKAYEFVYTLDDAQVYKNHVGPLSEQIQNEIRPFPKLVILKPKKDNEDPLTWLLSLKEEDLILKDYNPHKSIKMDMAV